MDAKLGQFFRDTNISFGQRGMQQIPTIRIMRDAKIEEYATRQGPDALAREHARLTVEQPRGHG
jgi:hypothetical protein